MPNIEDFSAGNINIQPTETGVEATARAGYRLGAYGSQVSEAYRQAGTAVGQVATAAEQYLTLRDINTGAKHAADFRVQKDQQWSDFITGRDIPQDAPNRQDLIDQRINNPNIGKQWRDQNLEGSLQDFESGFLTPGGREWANKWANDYRSHMAEHIAADQSSMAGAVVQANKEKMTDSLAVAAFNSPGTLDSIVKQYDDSMQGIVGSHPTLKPEHAAKIITEGAQADKTKLIQAAIQGTILKGGNWQSIASDPAYAPYIKPAENAMFARQAQTYARMDRAAANQERAAQDYFRKQDWNVAADKLELATIPQNVGDPVTLPQNYWSDLKTLGTKPGTDPARLRALIDNGEKVTERMNMPKVATDPAVRDSLYTEAAAGTLTEAKIAANITKLDDNDVKRLGDTVKMMRDSEINDPLVKEALAGAKELIEGKTDLERSMSAGKFASFEYNFLRQYSAAVRAGQVPDNALDLEGGTGDKPPSMISDAMKPYKNTVQELLRKSIGANGLVAPPPVPTQPAKPAVPVAPEIGTTRFYQGKGYQFQGGDWNDPKNWKEIS